MLQNWRGCIIACQRLCPLLLLATAHSILAELVADDGHSSLQAAAHRPLRTPGLPWCDKASYHQIILWTPEKQILHPSRWNRAEKLVPKMAEMLKYFDILSNEKANRTQDAFNRFANPRPWTHCPSRSRCTPSKQSILGCTRCLGAVHHSGRSAHIHVAGGLSSFFFPEVMQVKKVNWRWLIRNQPGCPKRSLHQRKGPRCKHGGVGSRMQHLEGIQFMLVKWNSSHAHANPMEPAHCKGAPVVSPAHTHWLATVGTLPRRLNTLRFEDGAGRCFAPDTQVRQLRSRAWNISRAPSATYEHNTNKNALPSPILGARIPTLTKHQTPEPSYTLPTGRCACFGCPHGELATPEPLWNWQSGQTKLAARLRPDRDPTTSGPLRTPIEGACAAPDHNTAAATGAQVPQPPQPPCWRTAPQALTMLPGREGSSVHWARGGETPGPGAIASLAPRQHHIRAARAPAPPHWWQDASPHVRHLHAACLPCRLERLPHCPRRNPQHGCPHSPHRPGAACCDTSQCRPRRALHPHPAAADAPCAHFRGPAWQRVAAWRRNHKCHPCQHCCSTAATTSARVPISAGILGISTAWLALSTADSPQPAQLPTDFARRCCCPAKHRALAQNSGANASAPWQFVLLHKYCRS